MLLTILKLPIYFIMEVIYLIFRCRPQKEIKNQHVLITGAAQGIGAEYARQFAEMGNTVHCVDIVSEMINETVDALKSKGHKAFAYTCDLTKPEQVESLYKDITDAGYTVTILVNNAGVAFGASLTDMSLTQIQHSINVNLVSNMWLIKLFLPKMIELDHGHVVNMASLAGMLPLRNSTDYCAAKAGSIHMMTQLRMQNVGTNIKFTAVCPFFVKTGMITGLEDKLAGKYILPEELVTTAIKGIRQNKEVVIAPAKAKFVVFILKHLPVPLRDSWYKKNLINASSEFSTFVGQKMMEKIK